jgi:hypothetical protein
MNHRVRPGEIISRLEHFCHVRIEGASALAAPKHQQMKRRVITSIRAGTFDLFSDRHSRREKLPCFQMGTSRFKDQPTFVDKSGKDSVRHSRHGIRFPNSCWNSNQRSH